MAVAGEGVEIVDCLIELLHETYTKDQFGVSQPNGIRSVPVLAQRTSVTATEFFEGGRNGFNPEFRFRIFAGEYQGERILRYNGETYAIYRAYHPEGTDYLELYVERQGGTNGIKKSPD